MDGCPAHLFLRRFGDGMLGSRYAHFMNLPADCAVKCIVNNTASSFRSSDVLVFHDIVIKPSFSQRRPKLLNPIATAHCQLLIDYCPLPIAYCLLTSFLNPDTPLKFGDLNSTLTLSPALNTWSCTSKIKPVSPLRISVPIRLCATAELFTSPIFTPTKSLYHFLIIHLCQYIFCRIAPWIRCIRESI